ncbi:helix-turn-helix domain-containing protein [Saccharibacillus sp. CPCC 101409]|uniref:helix-turn-helix domain-containing protein n=1 Tax=Saccharibacillus sp. CPCC 101409 TaxID=3058041 RepID=UPI002673C559|nr:helix-turn-helix domain-containing protein [Saccharibacillus sp. CPCC 101409]MDO3411496.1 helix-turn-helix domain-containing protein [Saccharibacillus sp. CPCC 101409]
MSKGIYEYSHRQIELAFAQKDELYIEKETDYIFTKILALLSTLFSDKLVGIKISNEEFKYTDEYLFSSKHKKNLFKWLERLSAMPLPANNLDFGKLKIDFETWYYDLGGTSIEFIYHEDYLLKPKDAAAILGISKVTLNKYIKQGLECMDNGSQNKIPKHAVELMRDPVYSIRMQINHQKKKMLEQTPADRLVDINREITDLQLKYSKKTYQEAFTVHESELDDPIDLYRWKDLTEEMDEILRIAGEEKGF